MEQMEVRQLETVQNNDDVVEGYALKFGTLSEKLGNFVETIDKRALEGVDLSDVRMFLNHDSSKLLARTASNTLTLTVDDIGLKFRAMLPNTSDGRDALELVKRGDLNQCSFGFTVAKDAWGKHQDTNLRSIQKIGKLFEISLVSIPAYKDTDVSVANRSLEKVQEQNAMQKRKLEMELELMDLMR